MIFAFKKSRNIATVGGTILGIIAGALAFILLAVTMDSLVNRLLVTVLVAFVAVNIAVYAARLVAQHAYQGILLLLYEQLDPHLFLAKAQPLLCARLDAASRCTLQVHIANGYQYAGKADEALALLDKVEALIKAVELRGLVLCNKATCYLFMGNADRMQSTMDELKRLIGAKECKKEFSLKARHTLGYLQICLDILRGKNIDPSPLEKDFASSQAPIHKADVQYRLALIYRRRKDSALFEQACGYVVEHGNGLCLKALAQELRML